MTAPNPDELTDAAKSAIAEAVRIVREDKFEAYARESLAKHAKPAEPPAEPPSSTPATPPSSTPTPPPAAPAALPATGVPEGTPPVGPGKRRSLWWGDLDDGA